MATVNPTQLYEPCQFCGGIHPVAESDLPLGFSKKLEKEITRVIKQLWDGDSIRTDAKVLSLVGKALQDSMEVGVGKTFAEVDWSTPDGMMLQQLTKDVWSFSAAKNYHQLRDMTLALRNEAGDLRSFPEFRDMALKIDAQYNRVWLKTEYNQAVNSATMAARWDDFKKNADIMPYLQYQTVGDSNVRVEHQALNGIIRKISDPFWSTHYPPNGWNCRCDVVQLAGSHATETDTIPKVPIPPMFKTNLGAAGLVFPKEHPYYIDVPHHILANKLIELPDNIAYNTIQVNETGKTISSSIMHNPSEIDGNVIISKKMMDYYSGEFDIKLLPEVGGDNVISHEMRTKLFGAEVFENKCPDLKVGDSLWEAKMFKNNYSASGSTKSFSDYYRHKIKHELSDKGKQATNIVLALNDEVDDDIIKIAVNGYLNQSKKNRQVIIFTPSKAVFTKTKR